MLCKYVLFINKYINSIILYLNEVFFFFSSFLLFLFLLFLVIVDNDYVIDILFDFILNIRKNNFIVGNMFLGNSIVIREDNARNSLSQHSISRAGSDSFAAHDAPFFTTRNGNKWYFSCIHSFIQQHNYLFNQIVH